MRWVIFIIAITALAVASAVVVFLPREIEVNTGRDKTEEIPLRVLPVDVTPVATSSIFISSRRLEQGDTFLVRTENLPRLASARRREAGKPPVSGTFAGKELVFFSSKDGNMQTAIFGIDVKSVPGTRELVLRFEGGEEVRERIEIAERKFPITVLEVTEELAAKGYTPKNIAEALTEEEGPNIVKITSVFTPEAFFEAGFEAPLERIEIAGEFGNIRKSGETSVRHLGTDLEAALGTSVHAVNDGLVAYVGESVNYGKVLILDHGLGIYSLYLHLSEFKVAQSVEVKRGEVIALSGSTGYSISPHLHFSVKLNGANVDPLRFIEATGVLK